MVDYPDHLVQSAFASDLVNREQECLGPGRSPEGPAPGVAVPAPAVVAADADAEVGAADEGTENSREWGYGPVAGAGEEATTEPELGV